MSVDKNLFLYDLAVVSIMKGEEPYVKEWLDYYLLAGVDHFFIYDNESTPEFKKILQPYIDADIVTYTYFSGKRRLIESYNAAVRDYKFLCRYMAFVDGDEFILPKSKPTITEVVDDVLKDNNDAAGLSVNWVMFGSNNLEKADYSRGVLERFTRREKSVNSHVKIIANPRLIDYINIAHYAYFLVNNNSVNEYGKPVNGPWCDYKTADKIAMHHYHFKSREEYLKRINRGNGDNTPPVQIETFNDAVKTHNEVFDDSILKYRSSRPKFIPESPDNRCERIFKALTSTLLPGFSEENCIKFFESPENRYKYFEVLVKFMDEAPEFFFRYKAETFLTCFAVSSYLKKNLLDEYFGSLFEEFSLNALVNSLKAGGKISDVQLVIKALPKILATPYPAAKTIIDITKIIILPLMNIHKTHDYNLWKDFVHLDYLLQMLDVFDNYNHK